MATFQGLTNGGVIWKWPIKAVSICRHYHLKSVFFFACFTSQFISRTVISMNFCCCICFRFCLSSACIVLSCAEIAFPTWQCASKQDPLLQSKFVVDTMFSSMFTGHKLGIGLSASSYQTYSKTYERQMCLIFLFCYDSAIHTSKQERQFVDKNSSWTKNQMVPRLNPPLRLHFHTLTWKCRCDKQRNIPQNACF